MEIVLKRTKKAKNFTAGEWWIDGVLFCVTLEDTDRGLTSKHSLNHIKLNKKYAKTAIPFGLYKVICSWSMAFEKYMPLVLNVKGFLGIRVHGGKTHKNTKGCILLGTEIDLATGVLTGSKNAVSSFYELIFAKEKTEKITLQIIDCYKKEVVTVEEIKEVDLIFE